MDDSKVMMVVSCRCGQNMAVPASAMGKVCKCVKCGDKFPIAPENTKPFPKVETKPKPAPDAGAKPGEAVAHPQAQQRKRVGQLLVESGIITKEQCEAALARQAQAGGRLIENLIALGHLDSERLYAALSKQPGVTAMSIETFQGSKDLIALIPREFAESHNVLTLDKLMTVLTVGMVYPLDEGTIAEIERMTGLKVKAMLCKLDDLNAAIQRSYGGTAASGLNLKSGALSAAKPIEKEQPPDSEADVTTLLERIETLPALSGTVQRVKNAAAGPGHSIRDVAGIVSTDPAVAAKLLSVANASAYGIPDRVTNVNLAATLLGFSGTLSVVTAFDTVPHIPESAHFDYKGFWLRSMFCAAAAMSVSKVSGHGQVADAYTAGVLHEVGRLALAFLFPEYYADIPTDATLAEQLKVEEEIFGITHAEAGFIVARQWGLPMAIAEPIRFHHRLQCNPDTGDLVAVVALATVMTEAFDSKIPVEEDPFDACADILYFLEMDKDNAMLLLEKTASALKMR